MVDAYRDEISKPEMTETNSMMIIANTDTNRYRQNEPLSASISFFPFGFSLIDWNTLSAKNVIMIA